MENSSRCTTLTMYLLRQVCERWRLCNWLDWGGAMAQNACITRWSGNWLSCVFSAIPTHLPRHCRPWACSTAFSFYLLQSSFASFGSLCPNGTRISMLRYLRTSMWHHSQEAFVTSTTSMTGFISWMIGFIMRIQVLTLTSKLRVKFSWWNDSRSMGP